jgi:type II secretory pathway component PulF
VNQSLGPAALILLVIPAIALRIAVRALFGRPRADAADPMQTLLLLASTILFILAGLGVCLGLFGFWALLFLSPIVIPMVVTRLRHAQHRALIWALAMAAERGIPLSEAARAYADETQGDTGVRALALAEALERGEPLSAAVRIARLRMATAIKLAVRMGEQLGMLGTAMRQQLRDSQQVDAALRDILGRLTYLGLLAFAMLVISTFVMLKIVPVFERIFQEFGLKLPALTNLVINLANFTGPVSLVLSIAITLLTIPVSFYLIAVVAHWVDQLSPLQRSDPRWLYVVRWIIRLVLAIFLFLLLTVLWPPVLILGPMVLHFIGWFPRDLPLVWRLFKRYDGALVMRGLALGVRRGMPLPQAMRLVADCYPLSIVSRRVRTAADRTSAGADWCESLRATGLIARADSAVLAAAQRVGNLEWALEEMADSALRRQIYRVQAMLQIVFPVLLLALGGIVLIFVVGLFLPLITLIQGLT